ncbi:glycoside hydrolase family 127 protein [Nesterenkonia rhizosphaerae]|uniref:Glycoside hydrolase family 127 protein n=1 Tax=Nesterenkonia rhizosphaerae TaxID=1348272 RepID=A0ABP9FQP5_9MICC
MTFHAESPATELGPGQRLQPRHPIVPTSSVLQPLGTDDVRISGGFWGDRQQLNRKTTIPHAEEWVERMGWAANFDYAVNGGLPQKRRGREFSDSEVYKLLEGMAWEIGRSADAELDRRFNALARRVALAQESDGYLNTMFGRPGQNPRYSDLEWGHELYCFGHLIQAGVARARNGGDDLLVHTAIAAADHVCREFGDEQDLRTCGHPEIETALVELWRLTAAQRYLDMARMFIERRGRGGLGKIFFGQEYFQDEITVREADTLRGHAVRALYLSSGAVDLAVEDQDAQLLDAVEHQLRNTLARRTYVTGGMGAQHEGESFGADFALPPDRSYSETCAGIAAVQLSQRLLLATGDPLHADTVERVLFNVIAAAVAEDGRSFFYTNTLHQRHRGQVPPADQPSHRAASGMRAPWFDVSCCPTNLTRTLASLGAYIASTDATGLQIHQYVPSTISATTQAGQQIEVVVETEYPFAGGVTCKVVQAPEGPWTLSLRIPQWAAEARLVLPDGSVLNAGPGVLRVPVSPRTGESIELQLPVEPRWTRADPRVDAVRGHVAVERGPLVLALESVDLTYGSADADLREREVSEVVVDARHPLRESDGVVLVPVRYVDHHDSQWPYAGSQGGLPAGQDSESREDDDADPAWIPLIPYYGWGNRGPSTMRVWLPVD